MIETIEATNLKDRTFSFRLAAITAVVGPNRSGKTAVLDALRLALLGHIPALGKTGKATAKLVGTGKVLSVEARLSSGEKFSRSWKKTKAGGLTSTLSAVPDDTEWPLASLDPSAFLNLGATDRLRMLATLVGGGDIDPDEIARLQRELADAGDVGFEIPSEPGATSSAVSWLSWLTKEAGEVRKGWKQQADTFRKTLLGLESVEDPGEIDTSAAEKAKEASKTANQKLSDAKARYNHLATALQNAPKPDDGPVPDPESTGQRREEAEKQLALAKDCQQYRDKLAKLRSQHQSLEDDIEASKNRLARVHGFQETDEIPVNSEELLAEQDQFRKKQAEHQRELAAENRQVQTTEQELADLRKKFDEVSALNACPTCGQAGEGFQADVQRSYGELIQAREADLEKSKNASTQRFEQLQEANEKLMKLDILQDACDIARRISILREQANELQIRIDEAASESEQTSKTPAEAKEELDRATEVHHRESERARRQRESGAAATIRQSDVDEALESYNAAEQEVMEADAELEKQHDAIETLSERRRKAGERERIEQEIATAEKCVKALDAAIAGLSAEQSSVIRALTVPILHTAEVFSDGVVPGRFTISDDLNLMVDRPDGHRVSFDALSGAERLIATSALQVALGASSPLRVAVLDEFSVIDGASRERFVENLKQAVERCIVDQVILTDWNAEFWNRRSAPNEVEVIDLS